MPIPIEELRKAQRPLEERIVEFLSKDASKAYTIVELMQGVEGYGEDDATFSLLIALDRSRPGGLTSRYEEAIKKLVASGAVVKAELRGTEYFAHVTKVSS